MLKFATFDPQLHLKRLPLAYSLGDLSSIREIFTPESGDSGRTQLPILPPQVETLTHGGFEFTGYLVEGSTPLLTAIREFLASLISQRQTREQDNGSPNLQDSVTMRQLYVEAKRVCMNRIGTRLMDVIKQDRRLGLYNLYWLTISKYVAALLDQLLPAQKSQQCQMRLALQPIIMQTFQQVLQRVETHLAQEDDALRHYSQYIRATLTTHLGATFNYEFSRAIIADQVHLLAPRINRQNLLECAQAVFCGQNERYTILYDDFLKIYAGVRSYIEDRLTKQEAGFIAMMATIFRLPVQMVQHLPVEMLVFQPAIITLFADEIKQVPSRGRKKTLFRNWSSQLGDEFGENAWEFAVNDYLTFARDLRRSEIIAFLRSRILFGKPSQARQPSPTGRLRMAPTPAAGGIADKVSYRFEKGRIINDLRGVSLIFLDLRGFTEISAGDITDEELKEHLYRFFDPVVNILNYFGGQIKYYAGDGILAAFQSESAQQNHALDAVRAAVEIYKFFVSLREEGRMPFQGMGIGVHSGLVEEAYFFFDAETPGLNTVIGLAANLVGRLSSGKAEKKKELDSQTTSSLLKTLMTSPNIDLSFGMHGSMRRPSTSGRRPRMYCVALQ
jgi:class 3 adenylate cyclase